MHAITTCLGEVFDYKYFEQQKIRNEVHAAEYACSPVCCPCGQCKDRRDGTADGDSVQVEIYAQSTLSKL